MKLTRREFLKKCAGLGLILSLPHGAYELIKSVAKELIIPELVILENIKGEYLKALNKGFSILGGIKKFIKKQDIVVIKPNIAFSVSPQQAATTNPYLVKAAVELAYTAGAKKVIVTDNPVDNPRFSFELSKIEELAKKAQAYVYPATRRNQYKKVYIKKAKVLKSVYINKDILDADVFINLPIAKHHISAIFTSCMKNLIGATYYMKLFHILGLNQAIADLSLFLKPTINIVDLTKILLTNGPRGPGRIENKDTIIMGKDIVNLDAYIAKTYFKINPKDIRYIKEASELGIGNIKQEDNILHLVL